MRVLLFSTLAAFSPLLLASTAARADDLHLRLQPSTILLASALEPDAHAAKDKKGAAPAKEAAAPAASSVVDDDAPAPKKKSADDDAAESSTTGSKEVKVGGAQVGESVGGATGFVFKQGFYTEAVPLGGFFRIGGFTISDACGGIPCEPVATSQLQPYIALSGGYDIVQWLGIEATFGTGFVANAAPYGNAGGCGAAPAPKCASSNTPRDYGITMIDLGVVAQWYFLDRVALAFKLFGGATFLIPPPDVTEPYYGGNIGAGIGIRYATLLPNTFIGIDANFNGEFAPDSGGGLLFIPAFSFAPNIKYVF
jgi:hypothetical protein